MDPIITVILVVAVLAIGMMGGFFAATKAHDKGIQPLKDEADFQRARASEKERELAAANERAARTDELQKMLEAVTEERDAALRDKAAMEADERNFEKRIRDVENMRKDLAVLFHEVGDKMLDRAQEKFLARARDFFEIGKVQQPSPTPDRAVAEDATPEPSPETADEPVQQPWPDEAPDPEDYPEDRNYAYGSYGF